MCLYYKRRNFRKRLSCNPGSASGTETGTGTQICGTRNSGTQLFGIVPGTKKSGTRSRGLKNFRDTVPVPCRPLLQPNERILQTIKLQFRKLGSLLRLINAVFTDLLILIYFIKNSKTKETYSSKKQCPENDAKSISSNTHIEEILRSKNDTLKHVKNQLMLSVTTQYFCLIKSYFYNSNYYLNIKTNNDQINESYK